MTSVTGALETAEKRAVSPIVMANTPGEWAVAALFCAFCFQFMWTYHDLWRGKPYSLVTADECFALAAAYGIGAAVSLGPLHRMTGRHRRALRLRRPLGIVAGLCALAHVLLSLFAHWKPLESILQVERIVLGFVALPLLLILVGTSWPFALRRLGAARWKRVQAWAPVLPALVLLHFAPAKVAGWIEWFRTYGEPGRLPAPGGTLPMATFCVLVLALRAAGRRGRPKASVGTAVLLLGITLGIATPAFVPVPLLTPSPLHLFTPSSFGPVFRRPAAAWGAPKKTATLEVLCGPSLRRPVEEMLRAFEREAGVAAQISYDASNALLGQLRLRPHGDVFIPADRFYTDEAVARGLAESPTVVAAFAPVILVRKGNPKRIRSLADLAKPGLRVGMGDERATAIGKTTLELFRRNGIDAGRVPIVYRAPKIDELGNAVRLGSIDAAIVWDAVAWGYRAHAETVKIPAKRNVTVPVAVAIVAASRQKALARRFIAFMASDKGRAILRKHHYTVPAEGKRADHAER